MKLGWFLLGLGLVTAAALALASPAGAHQCASGNPGGCGPCTSGGSHNHADPAYACQTPGLELGVAAMGVGVAALLRRPAA